MVHRTMAHRHNRSTAADSLLWTWIVMVISVFVGLIVFVTLNTLIDNLYVNALTHVTQPNGITALTNMRLGWDIWPRILVAGAAAVLVARGLKRQSEEYEAV